MSLDLIIDTNLLVLLVVGITSPSYIDKHKKLRAYTEKDFALLSETVSRASKIIVTPNTLTETSNLLAYIEDPAKTKIFSSFTALINSSREEFIASDTASGAAEFVRLGLTDAAILDLVTKKHPLITADFDLYMAALSRGGEAMNFNHLREARGLV